MKERTVNQILEIMYDRFSNEEIRKNSFLQKLRDKLIDIKIHTVNGGKVMITNTAEIITRMTQGNNREIC